MALDVDAIYTREYEWRATQIDLPGDILELKLDSLATRRPIRARLDAIRPMWKERVRADRYAGGNWEGQNAPDGWSWTRTVPPFGCLETRAPVPGSARTITSACVR